MEAEPQPMRLPSNLMFASDVLSGYSRNRFKLETTSSDTASSGRIITVNLAENALLDMKSLRFFFDCDANYVPTAGGGVTNLQGILPESASALISKVEVYVNGVQVQSGANEYNSTCQIKNIGAYNQDNQQTKGKLVNHAAIAEINGQQTNFMPTDKGEIASMCIDSWHGFLNELSTRFLPTDLIGQIQIRITFASDAVLSGVQSGKNVADLSMNSVTTAPAYKISNMYFTIDSIVVGDTYNRLLRNQLQSSFLPLNYLEYYMFTNGGIATTSYNNRFSLSSGSIDKMYAIQRRAKYDDFGAATELAPVTTNISPLQAVGNKYVGKYFTYEAFKTGRDSENGELRYQWAVNNVSYPQYEARNLEAMADLAYVNDKVGYRPVGVLASSPTAFCRGQAVYSLQLNHPELGLNTMSGYNSRGINSFMTFNMKGLDTTQVSTGIESVVLVQTTAQLRISAGRALAVSF
tara:strand:+ start:3085 stop:4476 length:1392 start_codon:yes stop_codon:yes gene_type:complete